MKLYKEMKLSGKHNLVTKLDPEDYARFSSEKWNYSGCGKPGVFYASKMVNLGKIDGRYRYKKRALHREIIDCPAGMEVDHINGDTLDNRKSNLRICTRHQNGKNRKSINNGKKKGAYYMKSTGKWYSRIMSDKKDHFLGYFSSEDEAHKAYIEAADKMHGEFANYA